MNPINTLSLPPITKNGIPEGYPIDTPAGTETVVLLAREQPLSKELLSLLPEMLTFIARQFAMLRLLNPLRPFCFSSDDSDIPEPTTVRLGYSQPIDDPQLRLKMDLRERMHIHFDVIKGVSFHNAATPKRSHEQESRKHTQTVR